MDCTASLKLPEERKRHEIESKGDGFQPREAQTRTHLQNSSSTP